MAETVAPVITINESISKDIVTGKIVTATDAAALNVSLGFVPARVEIFNYTNPSQHNWQ